jgi:hypothetical protein
VEVRLRSIRGFVLLACLAWVATLATSRMPARADPAGVSVSIKARNVRPAGHASVDLAMTVSNQGSVSRSDFTVSLTTRDGLSHLRLVSAPPDSISVSCAPTPPGSPPDCKTRAVPPVCRASTDSLSCHYSSLTLAAAGSPGDSLTVELKARTGARRAESAHASAVFVLPGPVSARAALKLKVGGSAAKKRTGRGPSSGGKTPSNGYGKRYKPVLGKWMGTTDGLVASFVVSSQPSYRNKYDLPPFGYEALSFDRPVECPVSPSGSAHDAETTNGPTPFRADGSFGLSSDGISGGLTGARAAKMAIRYDIPANPAAGRPGCHGTIVWHLVPSG